MTGFAGRRWMLVPGVALLALVAAGGPGRAADEDARLADYYGFLPVEVYKIDRRIGNLAARDLDGDKVADIAVSNNARSRIDLLLSTPKPGGNDDNAAAKKDREPNEVASDRRMRPVSVPVNKEIVALQVGDMDGDGRADLVYYGTPAGIEILGNRGGGRFAEPRKLDTGEAVEAPGALAVADIDGDGRDDIALLTKDEVVLFRQREKGKLGDPERWPHTLDNPRMIKPVDLDGDGRLDLAMLDGGQDDPVRVRFSTGEGRYGPEERFALEPLRAYAFGEMDGKPGDEVVTIEQQSGRARVLALGPDEDAAPAARGRLSFTPLPPGSAQNRSLDLGDLDGDGKVDVVATDPSRSQLVLYRQEGGAGLGQARTFPGPNGGGPVQVADLDGDGKAEVIILSEKEKQISRGSFADGRLRFPTPLPIAGGGPVALAVGSLDGDKTPEIVYVTRETVAASTADSFVLRALARTKDGFAAFRWGEADQVPLRGINGVPPALAIVDVNRDGLADLLVFNAYGPPVLLIGAKGAVPAPPPGGLGPLAAASPSGLAMADLGADGPALLVADQAGARNLLLDPDGHWVVKDQFDSGRASAKVEGVAALDFDGDGVKEVVLFDRTAKNLVIVSRAGGSNAVAGTIPIGPFDDFRGLRVGDLDGDGRDDLLLSGTARFGVVLAGQKGRKLRIVASYEPEREEARLGDLIVGDLNGDGRPDLALTDVAEHFVEIATRRGPGSELARALAFKVFERKGRRTAADLIEPRDLTLGDVDGDGRTDLILLVHDRVLVYRQDAGKDREPVKAAGGE